MMVETFTASSFLNEFQHIWYQIVRLEKLHVSELFKVIQGRMAGA